jgi:acetyl esterase/lipase
MLEINVRKDVVFGTAGDRDLHCDIYKPAKGNGIGILMVHGGGWRRGSKDMLPPQAEVYCEWGFTCVATEYRLTPESPWPAQIHDVKAALRWMRASADEFDIDPSRIAIHGNSAGAHLSLLAAGTPGVDAFEGEGGNPGVDTSIQAVVVVYPPTAFYIGERTSGATNASALLGQNPDQEAARLASPTNWVSKSFPPTFMLHGTKDKVVPVSATIRMYNALVDAGAIAEMHIYAEQPHGWARRPAWVKPTVDEAALFLERYLVDREKYEATEE